MSDDVKPDVSLRSPEWIKPPMSEVWQKQSAPNITRMVVIRQVSHQRPRTQSPAIDRRFARVLLSDEQPWIREMMVGESWAPIPCGWVERAALVDILNEGSETVEVGIKIGYTEVNAIIVPAGESWAWTPADVKTLVIRSRKGDQKVTVTMYAE